MFCSSAYTEANKRSCVPVKKTVVTAYDSNIPMKKAPRETQTLRAGCSNWSRKFSPCRRPPSRGRRTAKIKSAGDGHYLYIQTLFGVDRCTQFRVIVVTAPLTHTQTNPQTRPITIHCAAKLSAHCKYNIDIIDDRLLHYKFSLPDEVIEERKERNL